MIIEKKINISYRYESTWKIGEQYLDEDYENGFNDDIQ